MDELIKHKNIISSSHKFLPDDNESDNPINKEETNPDGSNDCKLTDDYSDVQEIALDDSEFDRAENKKEELSENEEEEETEKKNDVLKEVKKKKVSRTLIAYMLCCIYIDLE